MQENSSEGGWFEKEIFIKNQINLLLIQDEGGHRWVAHKNRYTDTRKAKNFNKDGHLGCWKITFFDQCRSIHVAFF